MRILITGGGGLLGQYLNLKLSEENEIFTTYHSKPGNCTDYKNAHLNITDKEKLNELFENFKPEIVIHLAAISRPETCDKLHKDEVIDVNVSATKNVAELCYKYDARLYFTSTELVYDGTKSAFLTESAELNPISLYAESKLLAEQEIKKTFDNFVILRTSLLYGIALNENKSSFDKMYRNLRAGEKVNLFFNQYRSPLSLLEAARLLNELINRPVFRETINFGGSERLSRLELGEETCEVTGFDKELLVRTNMYNVKDIYPVEDVSMNTEKLQRMGMKQKGVRHSLIDMIDFMRKNRL